MQTMEMFVYPRFFTVNRTDFEKSTMFLKTLPTPAKRSVRLLLKIIHMGVSMMENIINKNLQLLGYNPYSNYGDVCVPKILLKKTQLTSRKVPQTSPRYY